MRFENKVLFVTGGASGLGAATARRFADEGAKVAVADINEGAAREYAGSLPDGIAVTVDTADPASVQRAVRSAVEHYGRIDVIFNNAGIEGEQAGLHEMTVDNWNRVTSVNGDGVFYVLKYGIEAMLETGGGAVVNTSSTAGLTAQDNISPYTFTKAGIVGLTRSAAVEYAGRGIRVNASRSDRGDDAARAPLHRERGGPGRDAQPDGVVQPHARHRPARGCRGAGRVPRIRRCPLDNRGHDPDRRRVLRPLTIRRLWVRRVACARAWQAAKPCRCNRQPPGNARRRSRGSRRATGRRPAGTSARRSCTARAGHA